MTPKRLVMDSVGSWRLRKPLVKYNFDMAWNGRITSLNGMFICDGHTMAIDCKINDGRILRNRALVRRLRNSLKRPVFWSGKEVPDAHIERIVGWWTGPAEKVVEIVPYQLTYGPSGVRSRFRTYLLVTETGSLGMVNAHKYRMFQALCYPNEVSFEISKMTPSTEDGPFEYVKCKVGNVMVGCIAQVCFRPGAFMRKAR